MARTHDALDDTLRSFIAEQPLFFVASAPNGPEGHVNLSPKGLDSFRVIDDHTVAYLDLTGSGVETIAHLRQNGRLTIMFCAFVGPPRIVRLYGGGHVHLPGSERFDELAPRFPALEGARSIITCDLQRIQSSCGYAVPLMELTEQRSTLIDWVERHGPDGLVDYWAEKNETSIDGLPGHPGTAP